MRWSEWRKAARSGSQSNCVEIAHSDDDRTGVRDSKNPQGPRLTLPSRALPALVAKARER